MKAFTPAKMHVYLFIYWHREHSGPGSILRLPHDLHLGVPEHRRPRLSESRSLPRPHACSQPALNTAFVPMSFIFHFVRAPVSGGDAEAGTAARTLLRGSRASQATSERVKELTKATRFYSLRALNYAHSDELIPILVCIKAKPPQIRTKSKCPWLFHRTFPCLLVHSHFLQTFPVLLLLVVEQVGLLQILQLQLEARLLILLARLLWRK